MTTPLLLVILALTSGVALLALYSLGEGRRVLRALTDRPTDVIFTPEGRVGNGPSIGELAPPLTDGEPTNWSATEKTERLVLFAEAGCEPCAVLAADLTRRRINSGPTELIAVVDDAELARRFRDEWSVIVDPSWHVANSWRVFGTPHVTLLDKHGRVTHNAIVNTRKEVQKLVKNGAPH